MKRAVLMILMFGMPGANAEIAQCSSYCITEINIVSVADTDAGNVQTYVGFGQSKEESEKNAMGACSHLRFDLQTCFESDRTSGRNALSDSDGHSGRSLPIAPNGGRHGPTGAGGQVGRGRVRATEGALPLVTH
jgi:hypothetical protein